jgi:hypothetical protein
MRVTRLSGRNGSLYEKPVVTLPTTEWVQNLERCDGKA